MLKELLALRKGDVVSFVGGGGKTSLMLALAKELAPAMKVVVTTTTRMGAQELAGLQVFTNVQELERNLRPGRPAALCRAVEGGKVLGVGPDVVDRITSFTDVVLVEADGARRLPVKVPMILNAPFQ